MVNFMEQIIKSEPLHIQAYNIMKTLLLEGTYKPGERIVEVKLAEKLGISRGPVREAIRMLIQDGLLVQNEGPIQVYQPTLEDIIEVFQCRENLEGLAARLAAKRISAEEMEQLVTNMEKIRQAFAHDMSVEVGNLDQQFHDIIIEASQNRQLIQLIQLIKAKISYMRNEIIRHYRENFIHLPDEHERIYQALFARDERKAETEMRAHIKRNLEVFYELMSKQC
jgi:DNA-binding GntR family transcriptional regulator